MIRIVYGVIILVVGIALSFAGVCRVKLLESFSDNNPEYTEKQHKLIGIILIAVGVAAIVFGGVFVAANLDFEEQTPKQEICNVCGGDLLCDVCGADAPYCLNSTEGYNTSAAHYCETHWNEYISKNEQ